MTEKPLIPVILSGGSGTRLWPVSRRAYPKPFMKMADGQTLAEKTLRRAKSALGIQVVKRGGVWWWCIRIFHIYWHLDSTIWC